MLQKAAYLFGCIAKCNIFVLDVMQNKCKTNYEHLYNYK